MRPALVGLVVVAVSLGMRKGFAQEGIYHLGYTRNSHSNSTELGSTPLSYPCWGWRGTNYNYAVHEQSEYEIHLADLPLWVINGTKDLATLPYEKTKGAFDFLDFFQEAFDFYNLGESVLTLGAHVSFTYLKNAQGSEFVLPIGLGASAHHHMKKFLAVGSLYVGASINAAPYAGATVTGYYKVVNSAGLYGRFKLARYFADLNTTQSVFEAGLTIDWSGVLF